MADPQVKVIIGGLNEVGEKVMRSLILDTTANLIETTPVDTGWAKANWVPAIGTPDLRLRSGTPDSGQVLNAGAQQQRGVLQAATYKWGQGEAFVSNNVPYINRLNDGYSAKAPAGFVQYAIERAVKETRWKFNLGAIM